MDPAATPGDPLPYRVEVWRDDAPDRVVGRAASMVLARAIFIAAQADFAGRRIVLCRGEEVLLDSGPLLA